MNASTTQPTQSKSAGERLRPWMKRAAALLIVAGVLLLLRALPVKEGVESFQAWVEGLGVWGYVAFALVYMLATVFVLPGSAFTLAAGAVFGLVGGFLVVWVGATMGIAASFLIGRYLARDKVAKWIKNYPKFGAIDRAIGEKGWKIVALLRLSPAVPFNLQNYLYGLTAIRFWPSMIASALFIVPGTFMYVYLGRAAAQVVEATAGAGEGRPLGYWVLLGVGLLATIVVTVYVSVIAYQAVKKQTDIEAHTDDKAEQTMQDRASSTAQGWPWGATVALMIGVLLCGGGAYAFANKDAIRARVAPQQEAKQNASGQAGTFDHTLLDEVLKAHVDSEGFVDYAALHKAPQKLDAYIAQLKSAPIDRMRRDAKLATLINAYNAFTLRLILDYYPVKSIKDIPEGLFSKKRWKHVRWRVGRHTWSLDQIEHEQIRPKFNEPRIHWALVCAAYSCPKLRNEAYTADRLDEQFDDQAKYIHGRDPLGRFLRYRAGDDDIYVTKLYDWYDGDFEASAGSVLKYVAQYVPALKNDLANGHEPDVEYLDYDWKLNSRQNRP